MRVICKNISKRFDIYKKTIWILKNINIEIKDGEFICILGPTGCGKTTLLRIIAGLVMPSDGEVAYEVKDNTDSPLHCMVFQESGIFPWMNILDNVGFGLQMRGIRKEEIRRVSMEMIAKMGLQDYTRLYPYQLSVGMKKKVSLACALVNRPKVLLLDEPLSSIDVYMKEILQNEILKLCTEFQQTVVYTTHDIEEALLLANKIYVIAGQPSEVREEIVIDAPRPRDQEFINSNDCIAIKQRIWGIIRDAIRQAATTAI